MTDNAGSEQTHNPTIALTVAWILERDRDGWRRARQRAASALRSACHRASRIPERPFVCMIRVQTLSHTYKPESGRPITALRDVSLTIQPGEYVAIIGRNGSGKSTLAKHLNALLLPSAGRVTVDDMDTRATAHTWDIRSRVGMVFQDPDNQIVATVVEEDVAFGPENLGVPRDGIIQRIDEALRSVGLHEHRQRAPHLLSAGQRQRVAIAGVLAMRPRYLVLDEATAMLDPRGRRAVLDIARKLHEAGMAIIHITHFMEEAAEADRVIVLDDGEVALDSPTRAVFAHAGELQRLGLGLPPVARLAHRLHLTYPEVPAGWLTVDELVADVAGQHFDNERFYTEFEAQTSFSRTPLGNSINPQTRCEANRHRQETAPVIVVENLPHTYMAGTPLETTALQDVNLTVEQDEIVGLIGPTGSGKSTLLQHLNGLLRPQAGCVTVNGVDLTNPKLDLRQVRRTVGLLFQQPEDQLFERYVGDDIAFGPQARGLSLDEQRERVRWAMEAVGLDFEGFKDRLTFTLSGGERRKVALAGVLALRPRVLVLDEPTAGLDPASHREFLDWLTRFHQEASVPVVIATHNMDDIAQIADRVYVLAEGRTVACGTSREVFAQSQTLAGHGLGVPSTLEVMGRLRARGLAVRPDALTIEEAVAEIERVWIQDRRPVTLHNGAASNE